MKVTKTTRFVLLYYTNIARARMHARTYSYKFLWSYSWSYFSVYFSCKLQNHKFKLS